MPVDGGYKKITMRNEALQRMAAPKRMTCLRYQERYVGLFDAYSRPVTLVMFLTFKIHYVIGYNTSG